MSNFKDLTLDLPYPCEDPKTIDVPMLESNCDMLTNATRKAGCKLAFTDNILSVDSNGIM